MIRDADAGLKDRIGRAAYVWTGAKNLRRSAVRARIKVDGDDVLRRRRFVRAGRERRRVLRRHHGVSRTRSPTTARSRSRWSPRRTCRVVARAAAHGALDPGRLAVRARRSGALGAGPVRSTRCPYELDGGDRPPTDRLKIDVEPLGGLRVRAGGGGVSTATPIRETWELDGDDARETLLNTGRRRLARDAFVRMRAADGFSHARSLAFVTTLVLLEGIIGLVGLASVLGSHRFGNVVSDIVEQAVPGPAGEVLTQDRASGAHRGRDRPVVRARVRARGCAHHGDDADGPDGAGPEPPVRRRA